MKKKKLCGLTLMVIALIAVFNIHLQENNLLKVSLANIEALANEGNAKEYWCCGNTKTCVSGPNYTISGKLSESPCQ